MNRNGISRHTPPCREVRDVLAVWAESTDLPEPVAEHLGECPACQGAFDRRFPVFPIRAEPVEEAIRRRLLRTRRPVAPLVLAAAAALLLVASSVLRSEAHSTEVSEMFPPDCPDEVHLAVLECPIG